MRADYDRAVREHLIDLLIAAGGIAGLIEMIPRDDHLLIENLAVAPERQGRGFGQKLMAHAEDTARCLSLPRLRLYTNQRFDTNIAFYRKLGFTVEQEEPFMGGIWCIWERRCDGRRVGHAPDFLPHFGGGGA